MTAYALTIFLSAFLLFQVQPIIARFILPWFGGSPAVWTTCVCFFQTALLAGYFYSDLLARRLPRRAQIVVHLLLLWATVATLPIIPRSEHQPLGDQHPGWQIFMLLLLTVGPVYGMLATTGPLLQSWFAARFPDRSPYRLFALSNFASLLALVSYPLIFEPTTTVRQQAGGWSMAYVAFVVFCSWSGIVTWRGMKANNSGETLSKTDTTNVGGSLQRLRTGIAEVLMWMLLALVPSVLLLAVTNELSQDVAVVPMMWVVPLALYLLTFIICFDHTRWYRRDVFGAMLLLGSLGTVYCLAYPTSLSYPTQFGILNGTLFAAGMTCHGELARMKPEAGRLTLFYLMLSIGGALGGLFVVVVAPLIFSRFYELPLALAAAAVLTFGRWIWQRDGSSLMRVVAWVSIAASGGVVLGFYAMQGRLAESLGWRVIFVLALVGLAIGLMGWRHWAASLWRAEWRSPERSPSLLADGLWWFMAWCGLVGYASWLFAFPQSVHDWGVLATLGLVVALWGAAVVTQFRPVFSARVARQLGGLVASVMVLAVVVMAMLAVPQYGGKLLALKRNFFGITGVGEFQSPSDGTFREIFNGRIGHGRQYLRDDLKLQPNIYYGPTSGVGRAFTAHPRRIAGHSLHVGVIGLGTGTLVVWGHPGDSFVYYEINPAVVELADEFFTYRQEAPVTTRTRLGDARVLLESDLRAGVSEQFDLLIVDAFSGDAIPRHLLTKEAMDVYVKHLKPDGVLAFHISNHRLNLEPVVRGAAEVHDLRTATVYDEPDSSLGRTSRFFSSDWVLVSRNDEFWAKLDLPKNSEKNEVKALLWTDDFGSLLPIIKRKSNYW